MLFEAAGGDGVCKNKKRFLPGKFFIEPFDKKIVLAVEHRLETGPADISVGRSVNGIAKCHVVCRHRLGDCAGGSANLEKAAGDFLTGADLGKRTVSFGVEVDLER